MYRPRARTPHTPTLRTAAILALTAMLVSLVAVGPAAAAEPTAPVRLAGPERIATAVAVSRAGWKSAATVVLARADEPADALSGSPLAADNDAPLLLSSRDRLSATTAAEITRLGAREVLVLGGRAALADDVVADVRRLGVSARRISGPNRYATAAAVADELDPAAGGAAYVVGSWQEALAVSGVAARRTAAGTPTPILLAGAELPTETRTALTRLGVREVLVGASVGAAARDALATTAAVTPVGTTDIYTTSLAAARSETAADAVVLATGRDYPDGLSAGAFAARTDAVLLLTPTDRALAPQVSFAQERGVGRLYVAGGTQAVQDGVVAAFHTGPTAATTSTTPASAPEAGNLPAPGAAPAPVAVPAGAIEVTPGQDLQALVDANPAGSAFFLRAGTYREQSVVPKDGDTFVGERGTVLSGARVLPASAWTRSGSAWVVGGQTAEGFEHGTILSGGNDRDRHPEELFVAGQRFEHVAGVSALGPGRWYFDYDADRVYLGEDPARLGTIELSTTVGAFGGTGVRDVTIANMTIERYATPAQHGAIGFYGRHWTYDWTVANVTVRQNHGAGIRIGPGMTVTGSAVLDNGQIGIAGDGADRSTGQPGYTALVTISDTEIARNGQLDFDWAWEGGASKLKYTLGGSRFERNWVHHNIGPGPWWDIDNRDAVIVDNLVEENTVKGIFYEISYGRTLIARNLVRNNGRTVEPRIEGSGIFISNSEGVEVRDNVLYGNPYGVMLRSSATRSPAVSDVTVVDNDIQVTEGWSGLNIDNGAPTSLYGRNRFEGNTHRVPSAGHRGFWWGDDATHSFETFQSMGQDTTGQVLVTATPGALPAVASGLAGAAHGAR